LRYIHANPKAAGIQQGFFYDFSNYGTHDRLSNDGITQWHPAFLQLGRTLEECAAKYRRFCKKYKPKAKPEKRNYWGSRFLPSMKKSSKGKKSPGQMSLPWDKQKVTESTDVQDVAEKFIHANSFFSAVPGNENRKC
jgi:putative transposase